MSSFTFQTGLAVVALSCPHETAGVVIDHDAPAPPQQPSPHAPDMQPAALLLG